MKFSCSGKMVSCCAHMLGLRWRENVDSGRGLQPTEFLSGMGGGAFFYKIFHIPFF